MLNRNHTGLNTSPQRATPPAEAASMTLRRWTMFLFALALLALGQTFIAAAFDRELDIEVRPSSYRARLGGACKSSAAQEGP
jgi:hypothetical protein